MGKDAPHPKYLAMNADEMEPGTCKDRLLLEGDPHQLIEGVVLSAYAIEADIVEKGGRPAFPVNISINSEAAHDTPGIGVEFNQKALAKYGTKIA